MYLDLFKCPVCRYGFETRSLDSLRIHCQKKHKLSSRDLCLTLFLNGIEPKCACGCGEVPQFWTLQLGFAEYVRGHHSRVKNNWGHNQEARKKSQDVRCEMRKRGEMTAWNRGKTKDTDERVASYGKLCSHTLKTDSECQKQRAEHMSRQWKTKSIIPFTGSGHPQWKGGVSALQPIVRSRLHSVWTYPKLKTSGFKCTECERPGPGLEVHHDQERFAAILQKAIVVYGEVDHSRSDDDFEKKSAIAEWVVSYHIQNNISGVVLCKECHEKAHVKLQSCI